MNNFRKLIIWKKAISFVKDVAGSVQKNSSIILKFQWDQHLN